MNKLMVAAITSLTLAVSPVYADGQHGRGRYESGRSHGDRRIDNNALWAGVAIVGAIAGLAMLAEHNRPEPAIVVPPPVEPAYQPYGDGPPMPAGQVWYYCPSSRMYYPYTRACPDGWQAVPHTTP